MTPVMAMEDKVGMSNSRSLDESILKNVFFGKCDFKAGPGTGEPWRQRRDLYFEVC